MDDFDEGYDYQVICDKIRMLTENDLLLLSVVAESFPRTFQEIHSRFNKKLQGFNQSGIEFITRHRLRYLQLMKLLAKDNFELTFPIEILIDLGIISIKEEKIEEKKIVDIHEDHSEVADKLNALLGKDEKVKKRGWRYLKDK